MKRRGFTLMEILVTLVIVAMFSTAVYAVFLGAIVHTRLVQDCVEADRAGQALMRLIERDVAASVPSTEDVSHFVGSVSTTGASHLEFITATDSRSLHNGRASDLVTVSYVTTPHEEEEGLLRLYRRENPSAGRTLGGEETFVLLDPGVKSFEVEYYDEAGWQSVWNEPRVPMAIRVTLVLQRQIQASVSARAKGHEFACSAVLMLPVDG